MNGPEGLADKVFSALRWTAIARLTIQGLSWVVTIATARLLTPYDYGLVALASLLVGYFSTLADLGLGTALVRQPQVTEGEVSALDGLLLSIGLVAAAVVVATAATVANLLGSPSATNVSQVLAVQCFLASASVVPSAMLSREMKFQAISRISMISSGVSLITMICCAYVGLGYWALVASSTAELGVRCALLRSAANCWRIQLPRSVQLRPYFQTSKWIIGERSLWYWYAQLDTLIVGRFLGSVSLGSYAMAKQLALIPVDKVIGPLNQVALPAFAQVQSDPVALRSSSLKVVRLVLLYALPVFWGLTAVSSGLVTVLLGEKWAVAGPIMAVFCFVLPFRMVTALLTTALTAVGRADVSFQNIAILSIVVPLGVLLGINWGVTGAAVGWAVSMPIGAAILILRATRLLGMSIRSVVESARAPVLSATWMLLIVISLQHFLFHDVSTPISLVTCIVAGAVVFVIALIIVDKSLLIEAKDFFLRMKG